MSLKLSVMSVGSTMGILKFMIDGTLLESQTTSYLHTYEYVNDEIFKFLKAKTAT